MVDRKMYLAVFLALFVWIAWPSQASAAELPPATQEALRSSDVIYVATRRQNGEPSSVKPVWFFYEGGDTLFFTTSPESWKARRIAAGSPLYLWVGKKDGPFLIGEARTVDDQDLVDRMGRAYSKKYWIAWLGFFKPRSDRVSSGRTVAYVVTLREGEPPQRAR
jgi:general stress protein 26